MALKLELEQCLQERAYLYQQCMLLRNEVASLKNQLRNAHIGVQLQSLLNKRDDLLYEKDELFEKLVSVKLTLANTQSELEEERQMKERCLGLLQEVYQSAGKALQIKQSDSF